MYVQVNDQNSQNNNNCRKHHQPRKGKMMCYNFLVVILVFGTFLCFLTYASNLSNDGRRRVLGSPSPIKESLISKEFSVHNFTWTCQNKQCIKSLAHESSVVSLQTCNMLCATPMVWPKPKQLAIRSKGSSAISLDALSFIYTSEEPARSLLQNATANFLRNLKFLSSGNVVQLSNVSLNVDIQVHATNIARPSVDIDESYKLSISLKDDSGKVLVGIAAQNFFGARHALETLSQVIWFDPVYKQLRILNDLEIVDSPSFPHRGVMVDTARNFFPVDHLTKIIDGMSYNKLNVLHLHLTDSTSFPILLPSIRELAEFGAYGPTKMYSPEDIRDLVEYARVRGIRTILEIDAPSHTKAGWEFSEDYYGKKLITCESQTGNGHLDPESEDALNVLENIYTDLLDLSDQNDFFHIGNDEVNLNCWAKGGSDSAKEKFWTDYVNLMLERLKSANQNKLPRNVIMWSSPLTDSPNLKDVVGNITVQYWYHSVDNLLKQGKSVIYSTVGQWYLDCGFGPWNPSMTGGSCDPYTPWQKFYKYQPWVANGYKNQTLGGEVCLWSEQVDESALETRVWPRSAAFAERVWSDPDRFVTLDVYTRLDAHRTRMVQRGIKAAAMWPEWCSQNPGKCGFGY